MAGASHEEKHGNGQQGIGARRHARPPGAAGGFGVGLASPGDILGIGDHNLLRGPDDEPDIGPHERAH